MASASATHLEVRPSASSGTGAALSAYRPDIDGLRAVAILSVVLNHAGVPGLTGGFTGVDIFFAISGYLIGGHIYSELRQGAFSYLSFYQRRARRILPAFFAVIAFCLCVALVMLSPEEAWRLGRSASAATLSISNILFWHSANYFDTRSELNPLLMTWSLGVEEQFYALIAPLMVLLVRVRREWMLPSIFAGCAAFLLFSWTALGNHPALVFYLLPARAWELGIGVALAVWEIDRSRDRHVEASTSHARLAGVLGLAGAATMMAPLFLLNSTSAFPGPAALPSALGAVLVIASPAGSICRRAFSFPPLVYVGKISYSWYLWHWPLLAFLRILYGSATPPRGLEFTTILASFAMAVISYSLIEQPLRRSRTAPISLLRRYAAAAAVLLAASAGLWLSHGFPRRFPALAAMQPASAGIEDDPCLADTDIDRPNLSARCVDRSDSGTAVALWGDSHAAALAPALRALAHSQGYSFVELAKSSCPPMMRTSHSVPRHPELAAACFRFNERVMAAIRADPRVRVVVLNASWAGYLSRSWQDGWIVDGLESRGAMPVEQVAQGVFAQSLERTVRALEAARKQVFVMDDVPAFDFEPMWKIATARIPARRALARWLGVPSADDPGAAVSGNKAGAAGATTLLKRAAGAAFVDLKAPFCDASGQCMYRDGDRVLYSDNNHVSPEGARTALHDFRLPAIAESEGNNRSGAGK
jgi:peptidoglycan/LPS O-acetylase OafA/YrhL